MYILLGQSNANGGGINGDNLNDTLPNHLKRPMSGVYIWNDWAQTWQTLQAGVNNHFPVNVPDTRYGTEIRLCYHIKTYRKENIFLLKYAVGGTRLADDAAHQRSDWSPNPRELYEDFERHLNNALNVLVSQGFIPIIKGVIWIQGEADAGTLADAQQYYNNFYANTNSLYSRLKISCDNINLPCVASGLSNITPFVYKNLINNAFEQAALDKEVYYLNNTSMDTTMFHSVDKVHYNAKGFRILSNNFFDIIKDF